MHVAVGSDGTGLALETKATTESTSVLSTFTVASNGIAWLRICRIGDDFQLVYRTDDGPWTHLNTYVRSDLPATLQVGAMAFNFDGLPDLEVFVDGISFRPASAPAACLQ